jgi:hypothetical protein
LIALILWLTILGRRDFVFTKTMEVDLATAPDTQVISISAERVKVKVSGQRLPLKKFLEASGVQNLSFDIADKKEGSFELFVSPEMIEVPAGVKVLSIRPTRLRVQVGPNYKGEGKEKKESQ